MGRRPSADAAAAVVPPRPDQPHPGASRQRAGASIPRTRKRPPEREAALAQQPGSQARGGKRRRNGDGSPAPQRGGAALGQGGSGRIGVRNSYGHTLMRLQECGRLSGLPALRAAFPRQLEAACSSLTPQPVKLYARGPGGQLRECDVLLYPFAMKRGAVACACSRVAQLVRLLALRPGDLVRLAVLPDGRVTAEAMDSGSEPCELKLTESSLRRGFVNVSRPQIKRLLGRAVADQVHQGEAGLPITLSSGEPAPVARGAAVQDSPPGLRLRSSKPARLPHPCWYISPLGPWFRTQRAAPGDCLLLAAERAAGAGGRVAAAAAGAGPSLPEGARGPAVTIRVSLRRAAPAGHAGGSTAARDAGPGGAHVTAHPAARRGTQGPAPTARAVPIAGDDSLRPRDGSSSGHISSTNNSHMNGSSTRGSSSSSIGSSSATGSGISGDSSSRDSCSHGNGAARPVRGAPADAAVAGAGAAPPRGPGGSAGAGAFGPGAVSGRTPVLMMSDSEHDTEEAGGAPAQGSACSAGPGGGGGGAGPSGEATSPPPPAVTSLPPPPAAARARPPPLRPLDPSASDVCAMVCGMLGLMGQLQLDAGEARGTRKAMRALMAADRDAYLRVAYLTLCAAVRVGDEEEIREVFGDLRAEASRAASARAQKGAGAAAAGGRE